MLCCIPQLTSVPHEPTAGQLAELLPPRNIAGGYPVNMPPSAMNPSVDSQVLVLLAPLGRVRAEGHPSSPHPAHCRLSQALLQQHWLQQRDQNNTYVKTDVPMPYECADCSCCLHCDEDCGGWWVTRLHPHNSTKQMQLLEGFCWHNPTELLDVIMNDES
jgi:hypothetical protein